MCEYSRLEEKACRVIGWNGSANERLRALLLAERKVVELALALAS